MDDKDKRYFSILVNFYINMYRDSGEIFCQDNPLKRKEQKA